MAEEYVDTLLRKDNDEVDKFLDENLGDLKLTEKQCGTLLGIIKGVGITSFIAGLKADVHTDNSKVIAELEKENAELAETVIKMNNVIIETFSNLTQAKELLKKIEKIVYSGENEIKRLSKIVDILAEAEQFLNSEVEK
jgi:hypothetical protein